MTMRTVFTAVPFVFLLSIGSASATTVTLNPNLDNTLIQDPDGALSNALGDMFAGRTVHGEDYCRRRAVVSFNVAASVPAGATITSAKLRLYMKKTGDASSRTFAIHKLSASWGEGTSYFDGGLGAPATTNDATWLHRFYSGTYWSSAGGAFNATASASITVGTTYQYYEWGSNSTTVSDVQGWLNSSSTNYGWLVKDVNETTHTSRRFTSSEGTSTQLPELVIVYTTGGGFASDSFWARAAQQDVNGDGVVDTVWHNLQTGELRLQLDRGTSVYVGQLSRYALTRGVHDLGAGPALVVVNQRTGTVTSVPLDMSGAKPTTLVDGDLGLRLVKFADVDGDGDEDFVVRDDVSDQLFAAGAHLGAGGGMVLKGDLLPSGSTPDGL